MKKPIQTMVSVPVDQKATHVTTEGDKYASLINILKGHEEYLLNADGIIISSNLEAVNVTGYEEWEVIGKPISLFYTEEDRLINQFETDIQRAEEVGQVSFAGWRLKKRNTRFWAKAKITALRNSVGMLTGYRMIIKDATHKAIYNYRMKRIRDEYFNLFNNAFTGIFKFRLEDSKVLHLNEKALEMFGRGSFDKLYFRQLFASAKDFDDFTSLVVEEERLQGYEFKTHHPGHGERWASVSCRYFKDGQFIEGILLDITEQKMQMIELERLNRELDQFIYHASHDLRSPLTTILGLVNLIEMDKPTKMGRKYAEMIKDRVIHLDSLLRDLVSITYNNKTGLEPEQFDFEMEVKNILKEFQLQYENVEAYLTVDGDFDFYSDPVRLKTILRNLISNALKYHNPQATPPFLKLTINRTELHVRITITDNGVGIDEQHLYQIFGMFYRASNKVSGTGLGLYIVKSMIDKLGGDVKVKSSRGQGTEFVVVIPNSKMRYENRV